MKKDNTEKLGNNIREIQDALIKMLGFDYETFRCTSCFEQNEADAFSQLNPKDAKVLLMKLLQLDVYSSYEKVARERLSILERDLMQLTMKLNTVKEVPITEVVDVKKLEIEIIKLQDEAQICRIEHGKLDALLQLERTVNMLEINKKKFFELDKCPTCLRTVDKQYKDEIAVRFDKQINELKEKIGPDLQTRTHLIEETERTLSENITQNKTIIIQYKKSLEATNIVKTDIETQITKVKEDILSYTKLAKAFGRNGIPSLIIENMIPEIETIANELLVNLDMDLALRLEIQKELKSGEIADTLDIVISRGINQQSYFNYSGGERFLIDLVLRVALSVVLLRRKGCNNSTLIIDEGMGNLDSVNRKKFINLISYISKEFGFLKIVIISHIEEIQEGLGEKIYVEKKDGVSELRYNSIEENHPNEK